jgi:hypothetical protein
MIRILDTGLFYRKRHVTARVPIFITCAACLGGARNGVTDRR